MLRKFSIDFAVFSMGLDGVLIAIALAIATSIRPALSDLTFVAEIGPDLTTPIYLYMLFPVLWVLIFFVTSVYDGRKNFRVGDEITNLFLSSLLSSIASAGTLYLSFRGVSRVLFLTFSGIAFLMLLAWRLVYRLAFSQGVIRGVQTKRVLIVGAGEIGRELEGQIRGFKNLGLEIVGFLDDDPIKGRKFPEILGTLDQARQIVQQNKIDEVVLTLPMRAYEKVQRMVAELHDVPIKVWVIPDYFSLTLLKANVDNFAGLPMLDLRAPALNDYQRLVKRAFDIAVSLTSLILCLPLIGPIALAIVLDSPGSILLRQKRVGENGRLFEMLKFRTMAANAEDLRHSVEYYDEEGHLIHKHADDPRVTKVGRFLRRLSLDEIPQLFNVLKGEMSLVGPRPELPFLVERYEPWQRKRFAVPQGMTGWWQVNGRGDNPMHLHTEEDLYYVQNYSILLDIEIMLKTIWVVLKGEGAY
jgi:exopolysaccharide biosynthesis polyprenyl glycosylphosphotransferase